MAMVTTNDTKVTFTNPKVTLSYLWVTKDKERYLTKGNKR